MNNHTSSAPIPSATIIIGRDKPIGFETFMVIRHRQIEFASGALVFPGGKVDDGDKTEEIHSLCDGVDGHTRQMVNAMVAAVRETFEESGILLARSDKDGELLTGERSLALSPYRDGLVNGKVSLLTFLKKEKLRLACDRLIHFAHWITPEMMPKRYDTHFFLTRVPEGQEGIHDGNESVDSLWLPPREILERSRAGQYTIMFPTVMNLKKLAQSATLDDAMDKASVSDIITVMPWPENRETGPVLCIPENAGYPVTEESLEKVLGIKN